MSALLEVRDLKRHYSVSRGRELRALDGVSFDLERGRTLGLVGESGSGKSTTAQVILGLARATSGSVKLDGVETTSLSHRAWAPLRRRIQMVFQDPFSSLDPRQRIGSIVTEPLRIHGASGLGRGAHRALAIEMLEAVGLREDHWDRYPHEFSGGQRQRIALARALILKPEIVILDEPVSALDVSVQAQVLNLLRDMQERYDLAYLFISHDLAAVRHLAHDVAVLYLGKIVEQASRAELFADAKHPYTRALLAAVPSVHARTPVSIGVRARTPARLHGEIPSPLAPPSGCPFHPRCPQIDAVPGDRCRREPPELVTLRDARPGTPARLCACHGTAPSAAGRSSTTDAMVAAP